MSAVLVDKTCRSTVWLTPPHVLECVREYFGGQIGLDPATESDNPTDAETYFTESDDGLNRRWQDCGPIFVNPPYGKALMSWVEKICEEAYFTFNPIVALLPGQRFETRVWQDLLLPHTSLHFICFIRGRLKFIRPGGEVAKSNPYGSMLYVFNSRGSIVKPLTKLGQVLPVWEP